MVMGAGTRRLMVFMPPRHGKSELISKYFPAWVLGNWPEKRVILTSYEADFAASWGRKARTVLQESAGIFDWNLGEGAGYRWDTGKGGGVQTAGVGGPITGKGADVFIIDDPVKNAEEANSPTYREKAWDWYRSTARTRLEPNGIMVLIMTRWHEDDLAGRLVRDMKEGGEQFDVISFPAIARENDPLGRRPGEPLWPDRYDVAALDATRRTLGPYWYASLYDQTPAPPGGDIFKEAWFGRYTNFPAGKPARRVQSWDTAHKTGSENSYSVCVQMSMWSNGYYVENVVRERMEYPDLKRRAMQLAESERPDLVLIEDKASGQSLIQEMIRDTIIPVLPWSIDGDKIARANACTPECEAGKVFLREGAPWVADFIGELASFPYGMHDDQVDAFTQAMNYCKSLGPRLVRAEDYMINTGFVSISQSGDL